MKESLHEGLTPGEALRLARRSRSTRAKVLAKTMGTPASLVAMVELDKASGRAGADWWRRAAEALGIDKGNLMEDPVDTKTLPKGRLGKERLDKVSAESIKRVGLALRQVRERLKLSLDFVAQSFGVTTSYISRVETGKHDVSFGRVAVLAQFYGVNVPVLLVSTRKRAPMWAWAMLVEEFANDGLRYRALDRAFQAVFVNGTTLSAERGGGVVTAPDGSRFTVASPAEAMAVLVTRCGLKAHAP